MVGSLPKMKPPKTEIMMSAAEVMTVAVLARPWMTEVVVVAGGEVFLTHS